MSLVPSAGTPRVFVGVGIECDTFSVPGFLSTSAGQVTGGPFSPRCPVGIRAAGVQVAEEDHGRGALASLGPSGQLAQGSASGHHAFPGSLDLAAAASLGAVGPLGPWGPLRVHLTLHILVTFLGLLSFP